MPSYKVLKKGFFKGELYDPEGKRKVLHNTKPFELVKKKENVPSWLKRIKPETAEESAARKQKIVDAALAAAEAESDIENASFMGEGESVDSTPTTV
jgi:hypothetical protein